MRVDAEVLVEPMNNGKDRMLCILPFLLIIFYQRYLNIVIVLRLHWNNANENVRITVRLLCRFLLDVDQLSWSS